MLRYALKRGYYARVGFEDTLVLPNGHLAQDNAQLVEFAERLVKATASPLSSDQGV